MIENDFSKVVLENGVTALFEPNPSASTITLGFFITKGSLHENKDQFGWTHFCEHMLFKGTKNATKEETANTFATMGGYINAATTYNKVFVYNKIPYFHLEKCLDMILDMVNNSTFDKKETDAEREVILNEMRMGEEEPAGKIVDDFMDNIFAGSGMGHPIIGTEESISKVTNQQLLDFYKSIFTAENLIVYVGGNFDKNKVIEKLSKTEFRHSEKKPQIIINPVVHNPIAWTEQHSAQLHIMTGTTKIPAEPEMRYALSVFNGLFGDDMSSRLFQRIREQLGLCYMIYSSITRSKYSNLFSINLSIDAKNLEKTIKAIDEIIIDIKKNGVTDAELEQAKNQKISELVLDYDNFNKRMSRTVNLEINNNLYIPIEESIEKMKMVTKEDIQKVIDQIFIKENFFTQLLYKKKLDCPEWTF